MAAITYKCPNCGGGLIFEPKSQKYHCEFCLSDFTEEEMEKIQEKEQEKEEKGEEREAPVLYTCPSCGAQIVTDATTAATFCYYCHNPVVLAGRLTGSFEPDYAFDAVIIDDGRLSHPQPLSIRERMERVIYLGDEREVYAKYADGEKIL